MRKISDWHQVIAAVVTVAGGLLLVWWQTGKASDENKELLRGFTETVRNSDELRKAVLRPLEGRWIYRLKWDRYFERDADENWIPVSEGAAEIRWDGSLYSILIGYENRDNKSGKLYSVGVSTGTLQTPPDGVPVAGNPIILRYLHRMSIGVLNEASGEVDYSAVPEKTYELKIKDAELGPDGRVSRILAEFDVPISRGDVEFRRDR
ncbi:MAG: hypothetical protein AAF662_11330 [Pseudomonadota bacterium]